MKNAYHIIMKKAIVTLSLMFGLLFAVATVLLWYLDMPLGYGILTAVIVVLLQYLTAPVIITMLYSIQYENVQHYLSRELWLFLESTCKNLGIKQPDLGIIQDGTPNAFTYGYHKNNADLVLTTGLIEVLSEEELKAVIAHELGHIKHNDFIAMTVVSLIPMLMYQIYTWTRRSDKSKPVYWVGVGAYITYIFSQYFALFFSRLREFYADSFSKEVLQDGTPLKSALVKIAYGCVCKEKEEKRKTAGALGIYNSLESETYLLTSYNRQEGLKEKLMAWDLKSIWGRWYELNSTHPLTAKRIMALDGQALSHVKIKPGDVLFFLFEAIVGILPWLAIFAIYIANRSVISDTGLFRGMMNVMRYQPYYLIVMGMALLIKYHYAYRGGYWPYSLDELLFREDASPIKGIPAAIEGKVIGKGIPGLFYSEDLVVDDGTAIMLVDYRQPFRIFEFLFGIFKADELQGQEVKIVGWYLRGHRPFFRCRYIESNEKRYTSYNYVLSRMLGYLCAAAGVIIYIVL